MKTDSDLERQLRSILRTELERESGPDPTWAESPAARRVAEGQRRARYRWPLRALAVAALITIGAGSALLLGAPPDPVQPLGNGWIAQSSGGDIYFLAPDQAVRRVIGTDGDRVSEGCPAFSPDGRLLAYGRVAGEATWTTGTDGSQTPSFATYRDSTLVIADVAADGHVTDQRTIDIGDGLPGPCPLWSPAGDRIAFGVPLTSATNPTMGAEGSEVWIVTLADGSITVLPDLLATDLEFSPDGSLLGIASGFSYNGNYGEHLADGRIHLYELASGATQTLESTLGVVNFTWSPDGSRIVYQTGDLDHRLLLIDLATDEQRVLDSGFTANHGIGPVWSPDGESIVYQRLILGRGEAHDVVLVWPDDLSADGTPREEVVPLFDKPTENTERKLYPRWVAWSPDGEYLLFSAWPDAGLSVLGVVPSVPGSPSDVLVDGPYPFEDPNGVAHVFWEPSVPIQTWQPQRAVLASAALE